MSTIAPEIYKTAIFFLTVHSEGNKGNKYVHMYSQLLQWN
jgi:hypothetical protein